MPIIANKMITHYVYLKHLIYNIITVTILWYDWYPIILINFQNRLYSHERKYHKISMNLYVSSEEPNMLVYI